MKAIEIDDEVFAFLQSNAIPYIETPNLTLRRLFKLNGKIQQSEDQTGVTARPAALGRKQPKADLQMLVRAELLKEGQHLCLLDYQGKKIGGYEAIVSGKSLLWHSKLYSMSELAKICLKKEGFSSDSVRGPAHWCNADGITVRELWGQFLTKRNK